MVSQLVAADEFVLMVQERGAAVPQCQGLHVSGSCADQLRCLCRQLRRMHVVVVQSVASGG